MLIFQDLKQLFIANYSYDFRGLVVEHSPEKYDELCKRVNDAYRENPDIPIRTLANELGVPFDVVWESIGFKDWFAFYDTEKD